MNIPQEVVDRVEKHFEDITTQLDIKPGSKTYKKYQALFFKGAIAALGEIPVVWGVCLMSGREIIEERKSKQK